MTAREQMRYQIIELVMKTSTHPNVRSVVDHADALYWWVMCDHPVSSKTDTDRGE
jgi:hypothetical protein